MPPKRTLDQIEAEDKIAEIKKTIKGLWETAAQIANVARITFEYSGPDSDYGGTYYPPKPADWVEKPKYCSRTGARLRDDYSDSNASHPEWEAYHPWDEGQEGWVSSSSRC